MDLRLVQVILRVSRLGIRQANLRVKRLDTGQEVHRVLHLDIGPAVHLLIILGSHLPNSFCLRHYMGYPSTQHGLQHRILGLACWLWQRRGSCMANSFQHQSEGFPCLCAHLLLIYCHRMWPFFLLCKSDNQSQLCLWRH